MDGAVAEHRKRCLYREWWSKRNNATINDPKISYNERFKQMHGETMTQYHARLKAAAE